MISKLSILCPVYNEEKIALHVLIRLYRLCKKMYRDFEICIVDDSSLDGTFKELKAFAKNKKHIVISRHSYNCGIEKTLDDLYSMASGDWVINFSLDGEWDIHDIVRMTNYIQLHPEIFLLIGKRSEKKYTLGRKAVSYIFNILPVILYSVNTYDAGSMKLVPIKLMQNISIISHGVFAEAERIIRLSKLGYKVYYIPIHHLNTNKKLKVIPSISLMFEACFDALRVWVSIYF